MLFAGGNKTESEGIQIKLVIAKYENRVKEIFLIIYE